MEQLTLLILLTFSMLFGSYFSGTIPMVFTFSEFGHKANDYLIFAVLDIVSLLMTLRAKLRLLSVLGSGILVGTALSVIIPEGVNTLYTSSHEFHSHLNAIQTTANITKSESNPHSVIGLTLVIGFVLMLLIDQFANRHTSASTYNIALQSESIENGESLSTSVVPKRSSKITATIGLVVHSAADGIALGAAATTSHTDVEMIVFLAIMLHKAPAAFGLVTFLMHEGLDRTRLRRHLLAFSLSAPIAAFITFFGISQSAKEALSDYNATGIAMLFSAGTFLYVATVHVLPEITQHQHLKLTELLALVAGTFIPSLLTVKHSH